MYEASWVDYCAAATIMQYEWINQSMKIQWKIHRIHRRQHVSEDDAGISKHRLSPYNAYYHNW